MNIVDGIQAWIYVDSYLQGVNNKFAHVIIFGIILYIKLKILLQCILFNTLI